MTNFNNFQVFLFFFLTFKIKMGKKSMSFEEGRLAEWLMQRTANPFIRVRFRYRPPKKKDLFIKKNKKRYCNFIFFGVNSISLFQRSSVVEQSAVNRSVVGSSPTAGANKRNIRINFRMFSFKHEYVMIPVDGTKS